MLPPASASQTLITGVYRSGTEFVSGLLGAHPHLSATMYHVNALRFLWNRYDPLAAPDNLRRAVADTADRLQTRYRFVLDRETVLALCAQAPAITYGVLYDALMRTLWVAGERRHWSEKCQLVWREIPQFLEAMPNGRAVLVVRDPRSVLASFKRFTYAPAPAYLGAVFNCFDAFQAAMDYSRNLSPERFRLIRYEDAAQDPQRARHDLLSFIGVDPALSPEVPALDITSPFIEKGTAFDVNAALNRWRDHLSADETMATEYVCGALMDRLGYTCATDCAGEDALRLFTQGDAFTAQLQDVLEHGRGMQAFPTDPMAAENWTENKVVKA